MVIQRRSNPRHHIAQLFSSENTATPSPSVGSLHQQPTAGKCPAGLDRQGNPNVTSGTAPARQKRLSENRRQLNRPASQAGSSWHDATAFRRDAFPEWPRTISFHLLSFHSLPRP